MIFSHPFKKFKKLGYKNHKSSKLEISLCLKLLFERCLENIWLLTKYWGSIPQSLMFIFLSWLVFILLLLLSVAFFTLWERKVMGLVHLRLGPNKVLFLGLLQPLLDAFKLLSKSYTMTYFSNKFIYFISPYLSLLLSIILWVTVPLFYSFLRCNYSFLLFICLTSSIVFTTLLRGWSSNSKYSFIGCMRSIAQSISYEAVFTTLAVLVIVITHSYRVISIGSFFWLGIFLLFPIWLFTTLAETYRAPFDFSERESELVSGFNTEYAGAFFAYIFLREYSVILASSVIMSWFFFNFLCFTPFSLILVRIILTTLIIFIRVTYCRFRYDLLMQFAWKGYLPTALILMLVYFILLS